MVWLMHAHPAASLCRFPRLTTTLQLLQRLAILSDGVIYNPQASHDMPL